jgi:DNA adenine methylase
MRTKPILRWPGGKSRHLKLILPAIKPHTCYVEPFAGGLAVLLAKERSSVEVVNDTNREIVALYRCAQFHLEALLQEMEWQIAARVNFKDFRENLGLTDLQRAARFLLLNLTSFAGGGTSFGISKTRGGGVGLDRNRIVERLTALRTRLNGVVVECLDWERCVRLYDSQETFLFLDPPYLNADIRAYAGWGEDEMRHLAEVLATLKGQWMLTVDGSKFCQKLFARWNCHLVETRNRSVNQRLVERATFPELFITSEAAG